VTEIGRGCRTFGEGSGGGPVIYAQDCKRGLRREFGIVSEHVGWGGPRSVKVGMLVRQGTMIAASTSRAGRP
jgi:hypothetical protein